MSVVILRGDAACLPLPDGSVDLIVTSPPYFSLRSYTDGGEVYPGQIGSEATPREYIAALLDCTSEWMRVLKPGGSLFVNLGDKYSTYTGANWGNGRSLDGYRGTAKVPQGGPVNAPEVYGIPYKSLMLLPQRYAIGCVDDLGLILRAEIVWDKPNGLPESVTDRVRRSHEQVFHFTRQPRYYSAVDEVREAHNGPWKSPGGGNPAKATGPAERGGHSQWERTREERDATVRNPLGKLPGSVWEIASAPLIVPAHLGVDHFAAYPPELVRRIVLGWSPPGICTACGEGRRPVADRERIDIRPGYAKTHNGQRDGIPQSGGTKWKTAGRTDVTVTGYACACPDATAPTRPAVVLDPFSGTGTTQMVASVLGRIGIGVDRSMDYCRLAKWRTADPGERARALGVPKPPKQVDGQESLFDGMAG